MKRIMLVAAVAAVAMFTTGAASKNIAVCHIPPGNLAAAHIINIDEKGVPAHIDNPQHCAEGVCDFRLDNPPEGNPQQAPPCSQVE